MVKIGNYGRLLVLVAGITVSVCIQRSEAATGVTLPRVLSDSEMTVLFGGLHGDCKKVQDGDCPPPACPADCAWRLGCGDPECPLDFWKCDNTNPNPCFEHDQFRKMKRDCRVAICFIIFPIPGIKCDDMGTENIDPDTECDP